MVNNEKLCVNVNMTGKEYIEYKEKNKLKIRPLSRTARKAMPYFIFSGTMLIISMMLWESIWRKVEVPVEVPLAVKVAEAINGAANVSWSTILKAAFIVNIDTIFIVLLMIGLAFVIHDFGFYIIKIRR